LFGYYGKILRLDLTKKKASVQSFNEEFAKKFIGGIGFCAKIIYDEVPGEIDAYDPRNEIVFAVGPLTATRWPSSSNYVVCSKSPLVCNPDTLISAWGNSEAKGSLGPKMKSTGYDAIVIYGKSTKPVYVHINEDHVEIKDATYLREKGAYETHETLQKDIGKDCAVACIGPAGEKLVRFACIMSTRDNFAGRYGMGAVMGSKNLKAIVVEGNRNVELAKPEKLEELAKKLLPKILEHEHSRGLIRAGTPDGLEAYAEFGDTPFQNWRLGSWEGAKKIGGDALNERYGRRRRFCPLAHCSIGCKRDVKVERQIGPVRPFDAAGPEYESLATLGALNLIDDIETVVACNYLCNDLGMDTISAGGVASFAFECFEKGVITSKDTDGLRLNWGNAEALPWLLWKIGHREGIGNLLAEGSLRASKKMGRGSEEWCIEVKGAELPGHDPRAMDSFGLSYALAPQGANHIEIPLYFFESAGEEGIGYAAETVDPSLGITRTYPRWGGEGKGRAAALSQDLSILKSSLCICLMAIFNVKFDDYCKAYNFATGFDQTNEEVLKSCERIVNLRRAFNCKCGLTAKHDYLPKQILTLPRSDGGSAGHVPGIGPMLEEYYLFRGWDRSTGKPSKERLITLGLLEVIEDLYS